MRYLLFLIVLAGCNDGKETTPVILPDSLYLNADTLTTKLMYLDSVSKLTVFNLTHKIEKLKKERDTLIHTGAVVYKYVDGADTKNFFIEDLKQRLREKDNEIASLKNQLNDIYKPTEKQSTKSVPSKTFIQSEIITPDENSLVVELDTGNLNIQGAELYLIPFKGNKAKMNYDMYCDNSINQFRKADNYDNFYFFNSVPRGKYIVKICYYYGGYKVVNKGIGKETITMQLSPPLQ